MADVGSSAQKKTSISKKKASTPKKKGQSRMPSTIPRDPLYEPYERYQWNQLRSEIYRRGLKQRQKGPERLASKADFINALRKLDLTEGRETQTPLKQQHTLMTNPAVDTVHDERPGVMAGMQIGASGVGRETQLHPPSGILHDSTFHSTFFDSKAMKIIAPRETKSPTSRGSTQRASPKPLSQSGKQTRAIRPRRGCRFRLINVLLSPDFNSRWYEMVSANQKWEMNQFWLDVHVAYMAQSSLFDVLHFHDALFVNINPDVILAHTASRLLQMWLEVLSMYRGAVSNYQQTMQSGDQSLSFFDFCSGRLDLLYLHMGLLLEPELSDFIMGKNIPVTTPLAAQMSNAQTSAPDGGSIAQDASKHQAAAMPTSVSKDPQSDHSSNTAVSPAISARTAPSHPLHLTPLKSPPAPIVKARKAAQKQTKITAKTEQAHRDKSSQTTTRSSPRRPPVSNQRSASGNAQPVPKLFATPVTPNAVPIPTIPNVTEVESMVFETNSVNSMGEDSMSSDYEAAEEINTKELVKKRRRQSTSTAIVEVPSIRSEVVPHPAKRLRSTVTTMTTRTSGMSELMLPPDEWDILENRLRKTNENLDRCHRALSGLDGPVNEMYRQALESDLRFYSAIKQRLQEQLLVVMQSGY